jgi:peroxiredoxin
VELQSHLGSFEAVGAKLWAISGDDPDRLRSFRDSEGIGYPLLLDPDGATFDSYGIRNENYDRTVPHPTVIVVDGKGIARFVVSDENYRVRPPSLAVLSTVERLTSTDD